jgi:hypothetical protein
LGVGFAYALFKTGSLGSDSAEYIESRESSEAVSQNQTLICIVENLLQSTTARGAASAAEKHPLNLIRLAPAEGMQTAAWMLRERRPLVRYTHGVCNERTVHLSEVHP